MAIDLKWDLNGNGNFNSNIPDSEHMEYMKILAKAADIDLYLFADSEDYPEITSDMTYSSSDKCEPSKISSVNHFYEELGRCFARNITDFSRDCIPYSGVGRATADAGSQQVVCELKFPGCAPWCYEMTSQQARTTSEADSFMSTLSAEAGMSISMTILRSTEESEKAAFEAFGKALKQAISLVA